MMADERIHRTGFPMSEVACSKCFFFQANTITTAEPRGECWRYPARVRRRPEEWCGEWDRDSTKFAEVAQR